MAQAVGGEMPSEALFKEMVELLLTYGDRCVVCGPCRWWIWLPSVVVVVWLLVAASGC